MPRLVVLRHQGLWEFIDRDPTAKPANRNVSFLKPCRIVVKMQQSNDRTHVSEIDDFSPARSPSYRQATAAKLNKV